MVGGTVKNKQWLLILSGGDLGTLHRLQPDYKYISNCFLPTDSALKCRFLLISDLMVIIILKRFESFK